MPKLASQQTTTENPKTTQSTISTSFNTYSNNCGTTREIEQCPTPMKSCHHKLNLSPSLTLSYCLGSATLFVSSLYLLVPTSIQTLPRDHPLHIRWRCGALFIVVFVSLALYPRIYCNDNKDGSIPVYVYLGISQRSIVESMAQNGKILLHVSMLYLGPLTCIMMKTFRINSLHQWMERTHRFVHNIRTNPTVRWIYLRNLLIAPIAEETIFRASMLPPLLASGFSPSSACWIAPLFFGVAHLHHYWTRRKEHWFGLVMGMCLQWGYTTLFGAYASHVFVRTGSVSGIIAVHSFCNYMGLPEFGFMDKRDEVYGYRWYIWCGFGVGAILFVRGFDSFLFPDVPVLPALMFGQPPGVFI